MGQRRDMLQRKTLARVDDAGQRSRVETARNIVYEKNYGITWKAVKDLLQEDSLVPTAVGSLFLLGAFL